MGSNKLFYESGNKISYDNVTLEIVSNEGYFNHNDMSTSKSSYREGQEDMLEKVRDIMEFHQKGLGGYFTISLKDWERLEEQISG